MKTNPQIPGLKPQLQVDYEDAMAQNVTPVCESRNRLGVGFQLPSGEVVRFALDAQSVYFLRQALDEYSKEFKPEIPQPSSEHQ